MKLDRRTMLFAGALAIVANAANAQAPKSARASKAATAALTPHQAALDAPDPTEVIKLWPGGAPGGEQVRVTEAVVPRPPPAGMRDRFREHTREPTLTVFRPAKPNGSAVILAPGGGYVRVVLDKEGYETARYLASRGYTCFVLMYRLPGDGWAAGPDVALQDVQRAIRVVRASAATYGVKPDRIVVQGFSAGGHVASSAITRFDETAYAPVDAADRQSARPDLGCLCYPVVALSGALAHPGSVEAMFGKATATPEEIRQSSAEAQVTAGTPPTIIFHAQDDPTVPVANSLVMFTALKAANVKCELHIFEEGQHGWGLRGIEGKPCAEWPVLFVNWMKRHGFE
jgi:acetyl esterase/lipase